MSRPAVWERIQSHPIRLRHQPDIFIPVNSTTTTDRNNQETISNSNHRISSSPFDNVVDHQINNQTASQQAHHVSVCVNDLHTTLFIDEGALNNTKTTINSNNSGGKGIVDQKNIEQIPLEFCHFSSIPQSRKKNNDLYILF